MNDLQVFNNPEFGQVRVVMKNNEPWFVGKDVAEVLKYSNSRKALIDHVDEDDKGVTKCDTLGGIQDLTVINESGLYSLVLGSHLPTAKKFKHWVTSEVLPSIRQTGSYNSNTSTINNTLEFMNPILDEAGITAQQKYRIIKGILRESGIIIPDITLEGQKSKSQATADAVMDAPRQIAERFLNEACVMDGQSIVTVAYLYEKFIDWCNKNGIQTLDKVMIGRKLHELGVNRGRTQKRRYWIGIKPAN